MTKVKTFSLNIHKVILNLIFIYPIIIFVSFITLSFLEIIYPVKLTKNNFTDFNIVNLYFMLFCTLFIGIFVYKNKWLNFNVIFKIKESKIKNINTWILLVLISGSFFLVFSKYIYFIDFYEDRISNFFKEDFFCFFLDIKSLWSNKLENFKNNDEILIRLIQFTHPLGIILLCLIYFYLFFLIIFFENLKSYIISSIIVFVITLSLFFIFTANKIILIYFLVMLPVLIPFKIIPFSRLVILFSIVFIYISLFLYFINYSRTACILKIDVNYSHKVEYSNPINLIKKKHNNDIINFLRNYYFSNSNNKTKSSLNIINFYAIAPKMSGEKLLEDHIIDLNNDNDLAKPKKKFEQFIIIKEILNKHLYVLNTKGANIKLFEINKEFFDRTLPVSTFSTLFINFDYWSYAVILLFFCIIILINCYLLKKTKSKIYYFSLIYFILIFFTLVVSIHGVNILATQYASFIFFDILIALIIIINSGELRLKHAKLEK